MSRRFFDFFKNFLSHPLQELFVGGSGLYIEAVESIQAALGAGRHLGFPALDGEGALDSV